MDFECGEESVQLKATSSKSGRAYVFALQKNGGHFGHTQMKVPYQIGDFSKLCCLAMSPWPTWKPLHLYCLPEAKLVEFNVLQSDQSEGVESLGLFPQGDSRSPSVHWNEDMIDFEASYSEMDGFLQNRFA